MLLYLNYFIKTSDFGQKLSGKRQIGSKTLCSLAFGINTKIKTFTFIVAEKLCISENARQTVAIAK